jgi:hypothetical protein
MPPDEAKPSCWKEKGSNERHSTKGACYTANVPPNINNQISQILR